MDPDIERLLRKVSSAKFKPTRQQRIAMSRYVDQCCQEFAVGDPVEILGRRGNVNGHIARKTRKNAIVVTEDGRTFEASWPLLLARDGVARKRVVTPNDEAKARFRVGDRVEFTASGRAVHGKIVRMNPAKAVVDCGSSGRWRAHYSLLTKALTGVQDDPARTLEAVEAKANRLMAKHGLKGWSFQFDDAARRAGACSHRSRVISLARGYCLEASEAEWTDTILHEIAHALVGPAHHHDAVWKETARIIGCTADRCHSVTFTPPRYILSCPRCRWAVTRHRRKRRLVCRECDTALVYSPFSDELWARMRDGGREARGRP